MPTNWYEAKKVVFRCKISIRDGEELKSFSTEFKINNKL